MTSEERHEARYKRRKVRRDSKRKKVLETYGDYYKVISRDALSGAAKQAAKGVKYKASVQRFMLRRLTNVAAINRNLVYHKDIRKGFICFNLIERGKLRKIMSVHFSERVPQKSLNQNALIPVLTRSLIHDNGASRKGMGTGHAMKRLVGHLRWHYRRYGTEGYILLLDFKDYFGSIDHGVVKEIIAKAFDDPGIIWLTNLFVDAYYEYNVKVKNLPEDEAHKGLGLGSEVNQTLAITVPSPMDHYIKEKLRIHGYGRYNDDSYLISLRKENLMCYLEEIRKICGKLKITVNEKKTRIVKLSHGFTYLKTQIYLTDTGKIIRKPCHKAVVRERRKLKKQKKLLDAGVMTFDDIRCSYSSWRGSMKYRNARKTVHSMDKLFDSLFIESWAKGGVQHG
jgi:hypothetical protein